MSDTGSPPAAKQAQDKTAEAQERVQEAAGEAGEKVQEAAGTAQEKLRDQLDQRSTKAGETVTDTAQDLRSVGEELRKQGKDAPARIADKAAEQAERVGSYLKQADGDKMLSDVEDLGRRQPLALLAGGLAVGIAAARVLKASSHGRYQSRRGSEEVTRELDATATTQPRGVYAEGTGDGISRESGRQAPVPGSETPVPSGAGAGR
jgi:hypothetical protein